MRFVDWFTVLAIILGPILAIQVSVYLERKREALKRKAGVFKTLMATRANRLSFEHVQALNTIDIEFYGKGRRNKAVLMRGKLTSTCLETIL